MKTFIPWLIVISLFVTAGCNGCNDSNKCDFVVDFIYQEIIDNFEGGCEWDGYISNTTADEIQKNWQRKWEFKNDTGIVNGIVPDSFFVNLYALEYLALSRHYNSDLKLSEPCGFRIYYGLTRPGDITSMGLVITAVDTGLTDQIFGDNPKIIFTNNSIDSLNKEKLTFPLDTITLDSAISYTTNWRHYNGVCLDNDILGNKVCPYPNIDRPIPPEGSLPPNVTQVVPLGQTFSGLSVFEKILCEQPDASSLVICNVMYSLMDTLQPGNPGEVAENGYRYDFYLKGFKARRDSGGIKTEVKNLFYVESGDEDCISGDCPVDISNGCPPFCDIEDILQRDGAEKPLLKE